ncbi:MAG: hypothetical protein JRF30_07390 [Deltaproteobacteria bacterium]|nr:hypothetical protein [Deltaproteobacteria bacterium]
MEKFVNTCEIIWPYRFDLLVRIDFLEWFETVGRDYLPESNLSTITSDLLISSPKFFIRAKQHPYFVQYAKLKRKYRLVNLTYQKAETVYAEGIASFIKLNEDVKANSFNLQRKIVLKKAFFNTKTYLKRWHIGDGCHRLACLVWLNKEFLIPRRYLKYRYRLTHNPANSNLTAGYRILGILKEEDVEHFDKIFGRGDMPEWNSTFQRVAEIRERFKLMDLEGMFNFRFKRLDFG